MIPRGVRGRLTITIIGLVALTAFVLGLGAYLYVATSLRNQQLQAARDLTGYNVGTLAVERLPADPTPDELRSSRLLDGFAARGIAGTLVDFGTGDPFVFPLAAVAARDRLSGELRSIVASGHVGYERLVLDGHPFLVTGARRPPDGPDFYFLFDSGDVEGAIDRLGQALVAGGLILTGIAALTGRAAARRILTPVRDASAVASRIASGDLSARLAPESADEFGAWARSFNRMAASLEEKIGELQMAQARERRFVADVSHELRTPLTALVSEASMLRDHIDALPPGGRRAGELLVQDIARLRTLVEELIEISRFDAAAEEIQFAEFEVGEFVRAVVAARLPEARLDLPNERTVVVSDRRRLERALANLLDNARVHAGGETVEVRARLTPGTRAASDDGTQPVQLLVVEVADRGPGVDPAELPRLFERFHKADPSRHQGGSGLGLAIATEHVRLLGGSVTADLREGGGMTFAIRVPVTRLLPASDDPVIRDAESPGHRIQPTESAP